MIRSKLLACLFFSAAVVFSFCLCVGCAVKAVQKTPVPVEANIEAVRAVLETGDWVVIRGVTAPGNFFSSVTNMPFTHAAIYDAETDEVVEADRHGVHLSPLVDLLALSSRIWVIKPIWASPERRPQAVNRARSRLGRPYDYTGLIGLNLPGSFYCAELAIDAWRPFIADLGDNPIPPVIAPGQLHHWGRVVFDSLEIGPDRNRHVPESERSQSPKGPVSCRSRECR